VQILRFQFISKREPERDTRTEKSAELAVPFHVCLKTKRLRNAGVSFPELCSRARDHFLIVISCASTERCLVCRGAMKQYFTSLPHTHSRLGSRVHSVDACGSRKLRRARERRSRPSRPGSAINRFQSQSAPQMQLRRCISPAR
jgi:hypothetical protein